MMDEFGLESIDPLADEIIARSERAMREAIRALPDGVYEHEVWSDGFEEPILIVATVTVDGEEIDIDFAGSSPQSRRGINVVLNYTHGYASFAMKAAITPMCRTTKARSGRCTSARRRLDPQLRRAGGGRLAASGRPLRTQRHLRRAGAGAAGAAVGGQRRPDLAERLARRAPGERRAFMTAIFQVGGIGARADQGRAEHTGFP